MPRPDHGITLDGPAGDEYLSRGCGYLAHVVLVYDAVRFRRLPADAKLHADLRRCRCGLVLRTYGLALPSDDAADGYVRLPDNGADERDPADLDVPEYHDGSERRQSWARGRRTAILARRSAASRAAWPAGRTSRS